MNTVNTERKITILGIKQLVTDDTCRENKDQKERYWSNFGQNDFFPVTDTVS